MLTRVSILPQLKVHTRVSQLPESFYRRVSPQALSNPYLVAFSPAVADLLDIDPAGTGGPKDWAWPIYILYCLFFVQFAALLASGRWRLMGRIILWCAAFFGVAGGIAFLAGLGDGGIGIFILGISDTGLPDYAMNNPTVFYPALAGLLALYAIPFYFRWKRVYGAVNGYRIILLSLLAIALAGLLGLAAIQWLHATGAFQDFIFSRSGS